MSLPVELELVFEAFDRNAQVNRAVLATLDMRDAPLGWLLAVGLCSGLAGLAYLYVTTGYSPDTKLAPAALVDGVVVPSHPVE